MCDFRFSHLKSALLVLASVLAPSALALTCYRCANLKVSSNPDTCVDRALWSEVNGTMGSKDRCVDCNFNRERNYVCSIWRCMIHAGAAS